MSVPLRLVFIGFWVLESIFIVLFITSEHAGRPPRTLVFKMLSSATYLGYAVSLIACTGDFGRSVRLVLAALCFSFLADFDSGVISQLRLFELSQYQKLRHNLALLAGVLFIGHMVCMGLAFYFGMRDSGIPFGWQYWVLICVPLPVVIALDITLDLNIMGRLVHAPLLIVPVLLLAAIFILCMAAIIEYGVYRTAYDPFAGISAVLGILFYIYDVSIFAIRGTENKLYQSFRVWGIAYTFYFLAQMMLAGALLGFGGYGNLLFR